MLQILTAHCYSRVTVNTAAEFRASVCACLCVCVCAKQTFEPFNLRTKTCFHSSPSCPRPPFASRSFCRANGDLCIQIYPGNIPRPGGWSVWKWGLDSSVARNTTRTPHTVQPFAVRSPAVRSALSVNVCVFRAHRMCVFVCSFAYAVAHRRRNYTLTYTHGGRFCCWLAVRPTAVKHRRHSTRGHGISTSPLRDHRAHTVRTECRATIQRSPSRRVRVCASAGKFKCA